MNRPKALMISAACLTAAWCLAPQRPASAEHFDVMLRVQSATSQGESSMDTTPPIGGVNPRPVVHARAGELLRIAWRMKSAFPHGTMKGVTIHFFIVREEVLGQKAVPNPAGPAGIMESSCTMDFSPTGVSQGALRMKLDEPGDYLVRVQSEDTHQEQGHEHFSGIDVHVQ